MSQTSSRPRQRVLTGITTTGTPHLGNYVGAIRPAIRTSQDANVDSFFFLADYHALIKCQDPEQVRRSTKEIAATWLALGLDTDATTFYRQSDVPEITELTWLLTTVTAKGLMNRAHAYKASVDANVAEGQDADFAITMGLFSYPILMAADILMFNAHRIPVGRDQIQHIVAVLGGLDGRKMSKSYGNTIPLFSTEKNLQKLINKVKTNLLEPGQPKDTADSTVFQIWQAFATPEQTAYMREQFAAGIAWGQAKKELFGLINTEISAARTRYEELLANPGDIEAVLRKGAEKARREAATLLAKARHAVGIAPIS